MVSCDLQDPLTKKCLNGWQLTEKRHSTRISEMERIQEATNRRLEEVMESNISLKNMLQSFLTKFSTTNTSGELNSTRTSTPVHGSTSAHKMQADANKELNTGGAGSSEQWWDRLNKSSDDEQNEIDCAAGQSAKRQKLAPNVRYLYPST